MYKHTGLKRYFNKQERQDFINEMRKNGFEIVENNVPDMRKPFTSGYLDNKEDVRKKV
jgi:hypothetical protein